MARNELSSKTGNQASVDGKPRPASVSTDQCTSDLCNPLEVEIWLVQLSCQSFS